MLGPSKKTTMRISDRGRPTVHVESASFYGCHQLSHAQFLFSTFPSFYGLLCLLVCHCFAFSPFVSPIAAVLRVFIYTYCNFHALCSPIDPIWAWSDTRKPHKPHKNEIRGLQTIVARYMLAMHKPDVLEHLMAALSALLQDQLTRRENA